MRKSAAAFALLALAACSKPVGSTLRFDAERLDLGILHQYDEKVFSLPFRVEGGAAVTIDSLEVSCGCTDVSLVVDGKVLLMAEKKLPSTGAALSEEEESLTAHAGDQAVVLPAGVRGEVRGTYHPERRLNEQIVGIMLRGSMLNSHARAELRAVIEPLFVIDPKIIVFGTQVDSVLSAQSQSREVVVRGARPFTLKGWTRVPNGLRIEDLGETASDGGTTAPARRFRFTLDASAKLGVVEQVVSAGTDLGPDLDLLVSWRIVGPATYAPDTRVSFVKVPAGKLHEREVKIRPSLPEIALARPQAEVLGEAASVLRATVETLEAAGDDPAGWVVRCVIPAETAPGVYNGSLRITYPADAGLPTHEMVVNVRVQEPR